jgi:hypothetical protein
VRPLRENMAVCFTMCIVRRTIIFRINKGRALAGAVTAS